MNAFLGTVVDHSVGANARQRGIHHHSGSIIVMVAIFLSIVFILASSIDIGYVFYMKRDLQKTADLAALAGALQLTTTPPAGNPTTCAATDTAVLAAIGNAQANGFATTAPNKMSNTITVTCGRWDPVVNVAQAPNYFAAPIAGAKLNAVKVVVVQTVPAFFGLGQRTISGQAIASGSSPYATFSLGTGLLSVCSGTSPLLNPLVNGLLGSNVCLSAVTYNGLLGSQVSLLQIINNLGLNVGTLDQVLNTQVTLAQLINATIQALSPAQAASINVAELGNLTTGALGGTLLKLGDILNVNATDGIAALSAQINVLDLINVGTLQVANKNNLIDLGANIDLGALGQVGLQLKLIEPPQMGVGGVGATATSAQVRLALNVNALLGLVNLPLFIDVAPGQAQLQSLQCTAPKNATFKITTGVAEVCLANGQTGMGAPFSCPDVSKPANQVAVLPLVSLGINASLTSPDTSATLYPPPPAGVPPDGPSSKLVGSSLGAILGGILQPGTFVFGGLLSLLNPLLITLGTVLNPVLGAVGALLDTTFSLLGLGIGQSTLNLSSISCGDVKLVY
jgi:uncharacterized membrane protein